MNEYRLELPWPPGNNHLFSVFRGRKIKSKKGREYTAAVTRQITEANQQYQLAGRLKVKILAYPPTRARRDLDNLFKAPLDSLTHAGVITDDSLIDDVRMVRCEVVKGGRLEIIITELGLQHDDTKRSRGDMDGIHVRSHGCDLHQVRRCPRRNASIQQLGLLEKDGGLLVQRSVRRLHSLGCRCAVIQNFRIRVVVMMSEYLRKKWKMLRLMKMRGMYEINYRLLRIEMKLRGNTHAH